eukprot:3529956-Karenia_brevis.AAC.1
MCIRDRVCSFTAQHVSRMKESLRGCDNVSVTTCHSAFNIDGPEKDSIYFMAPSDLVMTDEFSLLTKKQFERLMKQWQAAEKIQALLFLGDKLQLPGMERSEAGTTQPGTRS